MAARVVCTFGRFNPPTIGHEYLVARLNQLARQEHGVPQLYLSHTQNTKTDPLSYADKLAYCQKAFGAPVRRDASHTIIEVMQKLERQGFEYVVYVAGSDRVHEFTELLQRYNHKEYRFQSIVVLSAGQRDPDAPGIGGMSASKLRAAAAAGDMKTFLVGAASGLSYADKVRLYHDVRRGLGLKEGDDVLGTNSLTEGVTVARNIDETFTYNPIPLFTRVKRALSGV